MKITLINPPISLEDLYGRFKKLASFQPPVGLASIAGYLLQYKHDVSIIDCNALGFSVADTVRLVKSESPEMVGLYTLSYNYPVIEILTRAIRQSSPKVKIVADNIVSMIKDKNDNLQNVNEYILLRLSSYVIKLV